MKDDAELIEFMRLACRKVGIVQGANGSETAYLLGLAAGGVLRIRRARGEIGG